MEDFCGHWSCRATIKVEAEGEEKQIANKEVFF